MLYNLGKTLNAGVSSSIKSNPFTVIDKSGNGVALSLDIGKIYLNGIDSGLNVSANDGDTFEIEIQTPANFLFTTFAVLKQDGEINGIYSVTTVADPASVFDPRYKDLEPYEVLPDSTWVPTGMPQVLKNSSAFDLDAPTNSSALAYGIVTDYHRDKVYVISSYKSEYLYDLVAPHTKPVSSAFINGADGFRLADVVLYRGDKTLSVFSNQSHLPSLDVTFSDDPIKVLTHGLTAYVQFKNSNKLATVTYSNDLNSTVVSELTESKTIIDFVIQDGNFAFLFENEFEDFDGTVYPVVEDARFLAYNSNNDVFVVAHFTKGNITRITGSLGNRTLNYIEVSGVDYISSLTEHNQSFILTCEPKGLGSVDGNGNFALFASLPYPSYGIVSSSTSFYASLLYPTMEHKIQSYDATPKHVNFGNDYFTNVGGLLYSEEVVVEEVNAPIPFKIPLLDNHDFTLIVNGIEQSTNEVSVERGDTLQIKVEVLALSKVRFILPIVLGSSTFEYVLLPIPGTILPREVGFGPVVGNAGLIVSEQKTFEFLEDEDTIFVSVDVGNIYVNGTDFGKSANISPTDRISVGYVIPNDPCNVNYQTLTYGSGMFQTQVAYSQNTNAQFKLIGLGSQGSNILDEWEDQPIETDILTGESFVRMLNGNLTADITLSSLHNASIVLNGNDVGNTATIKEGDKLQLSLRTSALYNIEHRISLTSCGHDLKLSIYTSPDWHIDPFDLGTKTDLAIQEYVVSNEFTVSGLGYRQVAPIVVPYGTKLFVNDIEIGGGVRDYRGVLLEDLTIPEFINNGDRIRLEGYPRGKYGTLQTVPLKIGFTTGTWKLTTYFVDPNAPKPLETSGVYLDKNLEVEESYFFDPVYGETVRAAKSSKTSSLTKGKVQRIAKARSTASNSLGSSPKAKTILTNPIAVSEVRKAVAVSGKIEKANFVPKFEPVVPKIVKVSINRTVLKRTTSASYAVPIERNFVTFVNPYKFVKSKLSIYRSTVSRVKANNEKTFKANVLNQYEISNRKYKTIKGEYAHGVSMSASAMPTFKHVIFTFEFFEGSFKRDAVLNLVKSNPDYKKDPVAFVYVQAGQFRTDYGSFDPVQFNTFNKEYETHGFTPTVKIEKVWRTPNSPAEPYSFTKTFKRSSPEISAKMIKEFKRSPYPVKTEVKHVTYKTTLPVNFSIFNKTWKAQGSNQPLKVPLALPKVLETGVVLAKPNRPKVLETRVLKNASKSKFKKVPMSSFATFKNSLSISSNFHNETELQQVFANEEAAKQDAVSRGLTEQEILVIPYGNSFIWVHNIPCSNMCYACPDSGYIQGG